jgi:hypothetical protein
MGRQAVDNSQLVHWRRLDAATVLVALADHAKRDREYVPLKDARSTRWHVSVEGVDFEILCTGAKFLDTRDGKGGGGAIDLAMHLLGADFKRAVAALATTRL